MRLFIAATALLIIAAVIISIILYPSLPDQIPSHWNIAGEIDGYMDKGTGLLFIPALMVLIAGLMVLLPRIDPKKENYLAFQDAYDAFILLTTVFLFSLFVLTILAAYGIEFQMNRVISLIFALLFTGIGILIGKAEPNWFVGIKTPWTLGDEAVWHDTHRLGAQVFLVCGFICLGGVILPEYAFAFILAPVLTGTAACIIYSYYSYRSYHPA
ncbi:MAG: SdpI family protein [Methanospirillaceae archaeon]|nr:SdpI family protein [Methanospirillaceae archaeon]